MVQSKALHSRAFVLLVLCGLMLIGVACGGGGGSGSVVADAEAVQIGVPLTAGDWEGTLLKPPEKIKLVGASDISYQAEGDFLVVFVKVTNHGDALQLVGRSLFRVVDGQGQEYSPVKSAVQVAYVLEHGMELSLDSPLAAGQSRDSVVIFDVPSDATGLQFGLQGSTETLDLGF